MQLVYTSLVLFSTAIPISSPAWLSQASRWDVSYLKKKSVNLRENMGICRFDDCVNNEVFLHCKNDRVGLAVKK